MAAIMTLSSQASQRLAGGNVSKLYEGWVFQPVFELIEGDGRLLATADPKAGGDWSKGQRVFHQKFGYGEIMAIEGDKLDIEFDHAGLKKIVARWVVPAHQVDDVPF